MTFSVHVTFENGVVETVGFFDDFEEAVRVTVAIADQRKLPLMSPPMTTVSLVGDGFPAFVMRAVREIE